MDYTVNCLLGVKFGYFVMKSILGGFFFMNQTQTKIKPIPTRTYTQTQTKPNFTVNPQIKREHNLQQTKTFTNEKRKL